MRGARAGGVHLERGGKDDVKIHLINEMSKWLSTSKHMCSIRTGGRNVMGLRAPNYQRGGG